MILDGLLLIAAAALGGIFGAVLLYPESRPARATVAFTESAKVHHEARSWPKRITRWTLIVAGLAGFGWLFANLDAVSHWMVRSL